MHNRRQFLVRSVATSLATTLIPHSHTFAQDTNEWAYKLFDKRSHDFGTVARGAETIYRLKLKNIYQEDVHIAEVRKTCGCTDAKPDNDLLKKWDETFISVTMNTTKFEGLKQSSIIVVFDRPRHAEVTIPIQAYIRRDVVIQPGSASFGILDREDKREKFEKLLSVQYAGRDDWRIREIKTNHEYISAKAIEKSRSSGRVDYDLMVEFAQNAPFGAIRQYITLVTDDEKNPHVPVLVEGEIRPDISVSPSVVAIGTMQPGQSRTFQVVLKGKKPFAVESVTCEKLQNVFQVRLPKNPSEVQVIPLTVTAPAGQSTLDEELTIAIPGRAEPVRLRAYGKIDTKS